MCGIAGVVGRLDPDGLRRVRRMTRALRHRGPDDEGYLLADSARGARRAFAGPDTVPRAGPAPPAGAVSRPGDVALGHRRLAIIDLCPGGHGPMALGGRPRSGSPTTARSTTTSSCARSCARSATRSAPRPTPRCCSPPTRSGDEDLLPRLNGMWAFALYDARRARALLRARPLRREALPLLWDGEVFAFASEIKGLLAHPRVPRRPDDAHRARLPGRGRPRRGRADVLRGRPQRCPAATR